MCLCSEKDINIGPTAIMALMTAKISHFGPEYTDPITCFINNCIIIMANNNIIMVNNIVIMTNNIIMVNNIVIMVNKNIIMVLIVSQTQVRHPAHLLHRDRDPHRRLPPSRLPHRLLLLAGLHQHLR